MLFFLLANLTDDGLQACVENPDYFAEACDSVQVPGTRDSIALTFELGFPNVAIQMLDRAKLVHSAVEQHDPDLITIDLGLPDGDGLQLIRQIRERSESPIIVLSARGDDSTILTAIRLGADDFLV